MLGKAGRLRGVSIEIKQYQPLYRLKNKLLFVTDIVCVAASRTTDTREINGVSTVATYFVPNPGRTNTAQLSITSVKFFCGLGTNDIDLLFNGDRFATMIIVAKMTTNITLEINQFCQYYNQRLPANVTRRHFRKNLSRDGSELRIDCSNC